MLVQLGPAIVGVYGLGQILGSGWPSPWRQLAAATWLLAVLLVAWIALYRWGGEKERRDLAGAARAARRFVTRSRRRAPGDR